LELRDELPYAAEVKRKALHLVALVVPLGMYFLGKNLAVAVLVPVAILAVCADVLRVRAAWFGRFITRWFSPLMRKSEQPALGEPVSINGATWVMVAAALLSLLFPIRIAVPAFVLFMVGDAAAALVGRRYGRIRWMGGTHTVEGSLAFLVIGLAVVMYAPGLTLWVGVVGTVVACLAEAMPGPFNDNLRVPLLTAAVIFALERFVLGMDVALFFG